MRKLILYSLLLTMAACRKDWDEALANAILPFEAVKVSRAFVQAGDELTVYGHHLVQPGLQTEVFLSGRPANILHQSPDSITVVVPEKTLTGRVTVALSGGNLFNVAEGPAIDVKPTPEIHGFSPLFAYGGEVIEVYTEHFSGNLHDNILYIGNMQLAIVGRKGTDTFMVKLPANASTAPLGCSTYGGPMHRMEKAFPVRQKNYAVTTVAEWLKLDPGFSFMDTLVRGYPDMAQNYDYHKRIYDAALSYMAKPDSTYTIFLTNDNGYHNNKVSRQAFIQKIKDRSYNYNTLLIAAVAPGVSLHVADLQHGDTFKSAFTFRMQWEVGSDDDRNHITIVENGGNKFAQIVGMYGQTGDLIKITGEHRIGNATIIELEGELGYIDF